MPDEKIVSNPPQVKKLIEVALKSGMVKNNLSLEEAVKNFDTDASIAGYTVCWDKYCLVIASAPSEPIPK